MASKGKSSKAPAGKSKASGTYVGQAKGKIAMPGSKSSVTRIGSHIARLAHK